jgi:hypothetical protein
MKTTIFIFLLTAAMAVTAMAQLSDEIPTGLNNSEIELMGMQTNGGTVNGSQPNMVEGNTFILSGADDQQDYALSVSLDYVQNEEQPTQFTVAGGSWTLSVFRDGSLVGTIYGDVTSGDISDAVNEEAQPVQRTVKAQIRILGGTNNYKGVQAEDESSASLVSVTDVDGAQTKATAYDIFKK